MTTGWRLLLGTFAVAILLGALGVGVSEASECNVEDATCRGLDFVLVAGVLAPAYAVCAMLVGIAAKNELKGAAFGCSAGCGLLIALLLLVNVIALLGAWLA